MFNGAAAFNADLSKWVMSSVTDMRFVCCERDGVALSAAVARVSLGPGVSNVFSLSRLFFAPNDFEARC